MHENFWNLFSLTGNIGAYLAYKSFLSGLWAHEGQNGEDAT